MEPQQNLRAAVNYAETPEGQAREQEMVSVLERIQLLYDTGTPLFSKAQFRNLEARLNSLKKLKEGEEIDFRIKGIDGVDVKIEDPWYVFLPVGTVMKSSSMYSIALSKASGHTACRSRIASTELQPTSRFTVPRPSVLQLHWM